MTKNQESNILEALRSIDNYCDSIVVVDTGSTDNTIQVVKENFPKAHLYQVPWRENYAYMRNECLKLVPEGWTFVIDSDEVFDNSLCTSQELKSFLYYLDQTSSVPVCTIKTKSYNGNSFVRKKVLYKKGDFIRYHGCVHEELITTNGELDIVDTNLCVVNKGNSPQEILKFDKAKRYSELLLQQLNQEPNNPRWVAMISQDYIELGFISKADYIKYLQKFIFINKADDFSDNNIQDSRWLKYLLARYALLLMSDGKLYESIECTQAAMKKFPYDANFLAIFISASNALNETRNRSILKIVNKCLRQYELDLDKVEEESQGTEDSVVPALIKLLINVGEYSSAKNLVENIDNSEYKELIDGEINFLL
ncbi:glycosyltransferase [Lactobacillus equicursoris]|nr:glycosyltransferase [Lactobacillus equicursoris]